MQQPVLSEQGRITILVFWEENLILDAHQAEYSQEHHRRGCDERLECAAVVLRVGQGWPCPIIAIGGDRA